MKTRLAAIAAASIAAAALAGQPTTPAPPAPPAPAKPPEKPVDQTPPKPVPSPAPAHPAPPAPTTPPPTLPSLDEALGLEKPTDKPKDAPPKEAKPQLPGELAKALDGVDAGRCDELERAVALMEKSAGRLEAAKDTSLETQRVQEETVRLLDALLRKNSQKKNSQNKPQSKPQNRDQNQQQPNQSQQSQDDQRKQATDSTDRTDVGGNTNVRMRPGIEAARAAWGNLPQRVRQLLMQGSGDQFSKEYQRLTEEYYKRLGEGGGN